MLTIKENVEEIVEIKKSKFIANIFYVENEEQVLELLNKIKKQYYGARHYCYGFRLLKENILIERSSDDGEPKGTAGAPILDVLQNKNIKNVLVVVTRYFGGILLGTGGLVKAYLDSTKKVLEKAGIVEKELGEILEIELDYNDYTEFKYLCDKNNIKLFDIKYEDKIKVCIEILKQKKEMFENKKYKIRYLEDKYIDVSDNTCIF